MKSIPYIFLIIPFFLFTCEHQITTADSENDSSQPKGIMKISLDMNDSPSEVVRLVGKLSNNAHEQMNFDFEINDKLATATVEDIPSGYWTLRVDAFNDNDIVIYNGTTEVTIQSGLITAVSIHLNPTTGGLEITVTWGKKHVNIPDENFLKALIKEGVDANADGKISYDEAEAQSLIRIEGSEISDLTGIESFINLHTLWVRATSATKINISALTSLTEIMFDGNKLLSLDVSNNKALRELFCDNNQIQELDVTNNSELINLYCHDNQIPSLDVSNNPKLKVLHFRSNKISSIDVSNNPQITHLNCGYNQLSSLDLSCMNDLYLLSIHSMPTLKFVCLPQRDVSIEGASSSVQFSRECGSECEDAPTSEIFIPDIALIYALISQGVDRNNDNFISFQEAELVTSLNLSTKGISDMTGIEAFINLTKLTCIFNSFTSLDLSKNTHLTYLNCYTNPLTSLNVSNCTKLAYLQCNMNQLTSLDVSDCADLTILDCQGNNISSLDVSNNTKLKNLRCGGNQLTSLDISNSTALTKLVCQMNDISSLDVSNNTELMELACARTKLTSLDLSANSALTQISMYDIPTLLEVCVWTMPFPPQGVAVFDHGSPNRYFTTDCSN